MRHIFANTLGRVFKLDLTRCPKQSISSESHERKRVSGFYLNGSNEKTKSSLFAINESPPKSLWFCGKIDFVIRSKVVG